MGLALAAVMFCASCSGPALEAAAGAPAIRLTTAAQSDWQASDLAVRVTPDGDGWALSIRSQAAAPAAALLLEVQFPPEYSAAEARSSAPAGKLSLLVTDHPGVLALGVLMAPGATIPAGEVLRARLVRHPGATRSVSNAPAGNLGHVPDMAGTENGFGGWDLSWGYYNTGDLNQDGQVAISDLTLLGIHFGEQAPAFPSLFPLTALARWSTPAATARSG